jgi:hypothetical protein
VLVHLPIMIVILPLIVTQVLRIDGLSAVCALLAGLMTLALLGAAPEPTG